MEGLKRKSRGDFIYTDYHPYADFEHEGKRPFEKVKFKNFHLPAGAFVAVNTLPTISKLRDVDGSPAKL
jgi:hypothetical protein